MPSRFGNVIVGFGADLGDFEKGLSKIEKRLGKLDRDLGKAGRALSVGLTIPIAGLGFAAVKSSGLLDELFARLRDRSSAVLKQLGADIVQALDLRELIGRAIKLVDSFGESLARLPDGLKNFLIRGAAVVALIGPLLLGLSGMVKVLGGVIIGAKFLAGILATIAASPVALVVLGIVAALGVAAFAFNRATASARRFSDEVRTLEEVGSEIDRLKKGLEGIADLGDITGSIAQLKQLRETLAGVGASTTRVDELIRQFERLRDLGPIFERLKTERLEQNLRAATAAAREAGLQAIFFSNSQDNLQLSLEAATAELQSIESAIRKVVSESGKPLSGLLADPQVAALATRYRELQFEIRKITDEQKRQQESAQQAMRAEQERIQQIQRVEQERAQLAQQFTRNIFAEFALGASVAIAQVGVLQFALIQVANTLFQTFQQVTAAIGAAVAQAIVFGHDLEQAWRGVLATLLSAVINTIVDILIAVIASQVTAAVAGLAATAALFAAEIGLIYARVVAGYSTIPIVGAFLGLAAAKGAVAATIAGATAAAAAGKGALLATSAVGLAEGALVTGPTLAMIGEGREDELVAPLSKVPDLLGMDDFHQEINVHLDGYRLARAQARGLPRVLKIHGVG